MLAALILASIQCGSVLPGYAAESDPGAEAAANAVHYVSINTDAEENMENDGATGLNTIAIGPGAKATMMQDIAIGDKAESTHN